jgi:hypothetical protein
MMNSPLCKAFWATVSQQKMTSRIRTLACILIVASLGAWGVRVSWIALRWETEMYGMATYAGALKASVDYANGKTRLYDLIANGREEYTGRRDGVFEIWTRPCYSDSGGPEKSTQGWFVSAYNSRMRKYQVASRGQVPAHDHTSPQATNEMIR